MRRKRFKLLHSILATAALLLAEGIIGAFIKDPFLAQYCILIIALIGGTGIIVVAMEAIEEVKNARHMLVLLSAVLCEFIVFFTFQYGYLLTITPQAFAGLTSDPVTLLLHTTMVFAFNPLYLPMTVAARALLLVNTLESMALVLFVLQNIWQFRGNSQNAI